VKSSPVLFFAGICVFLAAQTSSGQTVAVGNCRPLLVSYSTISAAVAAAPPNSTVLVCPGTYPEQVTINQPLTLRGLNDFGGARAVITVPTGGLVSIFGKALQLSVQGTDSPVFGPVNINNLVVDGTGSGFDCSTGTLVGIAYQFASGTLNNVDVRKQNPGGCGFGILLTGSPFVVDTVNIRNSRIHDFDDTGILATSGGETGFLVNVHSSVVTSANTSVRAGIDYEFTDGLAAGNTITLAGEVGLLLDNFFGGMTANENTIIGSTVGIFVGISEGLIPTTITRNSLFKNGTGIAVSSIGGGAGAVVKSNAIVQSSTAAIDLNCSEQTTAENNIILGAPVGIANVTSGDILTGNTFFNVTSATTACPF